MNTAIKVKKPMLNKVIVINVVWMMMVTGMVGFSIALYGQKTDQVDNYGPYASAHSYVASQY